MRTTFLLIFCFCTVQYGSSQSASVQRDSKSRYAVTVAPAIFPFDRVGLQPGFQIKMNKCWAVLTEMAVPISKASEKADGYQKTKIVKLSSELKYYTSNRSPDRFYSFQFGYMQRTFIDGDSGMYHYPGASSEIGYSRLTVKSPVYFFALKWGSEAVQWKRVFLDCFFGLGLRIIPTKYYADGTYTAGQWGPVDNIAWMAPIPAWEYDKTSIRPHFTVGFRVGGKF